MNLSQQIKMNVKAIRQSAANIETGLFIIEDTDFVDEWLGHLDSQVEGLKGMCSKFKKGETRNVSQ
jgi:hypothetical protein